MSPFLVGMTLLFWVPFGTGVVLTVLWGPWVAFALGILLYAVTIGRAVSRRRSAQ